VFGRGTAGKELNDSRVGYPPPPAGPKGDPPIPHRGARTIDGVPTASGPIAPPLPASSLPLRACTAYRDPPHALIADHVLSRRFFPVLDLFTRVSAGPVPGFLLRTPPPIPGKDLRTDLAVLSAATLVMTTPTRYLLPYDHQQCAAQRGDRSHQFFYVSHRSPSNRKVLWEPIPRGNFQRGPSSPHPRRAPHQYVFPLLPGVVLIFSGIMLLPRCPPHSRLVSFPILTRSSR